MLRTVIPPEVTRNIAEKLSQHGIKPTRQRLHIASVLFEKPQHLSADQVLEKVNQNDARVSKATVYNTLGLFCSKRLIREVIIDPSRVFYDSTTRPHHHVYNVETGHLSDLESIEIDLGNLPDLPKGTVVDGVDVVIRVRNQPLQ